MNRYIYNREIVEMAALLSDRDRHKFMEIVERETLNPLVIFGWNVWLGFLGIDRFILGDILLGVLKFLTMGGLGIWVIVDCFIIGNRTRELNMVKIRDIYAYVLDTSKDSEALAA